MLSHTKPSFGTREKLTHRVLYYLHKRTSPKHPAWRDVTIRFLYELFELTNRNASLKLLFHRADGLRIYLETSSGFSLVTYIHFCHKHFLIHANKGFNIFDKGNDLFTKNVTGSHDRMWHATTSDEITTFLAYLSDLPQPPIGVSGQQSRAIPTWVKEIVFERDRGQCRKCKRSFDLCFDHILPFSKGGSSKLPQNIQLLCAECNLEKSDKIE